MKKYNIGTNPTFENFTPKVYRNRCIGNLRKHSHIDNNFSMIFTGKKNNINVSKISKNL